MASSIIGCKTPRSLETSSASVPGAGPALPSGVCSVSGGLCASGSGIKAPLAAGAWRGERNSPPGQPRLGWGVRLLSLFGCCKLEKSCVMMAGKMRLVPSEKEQPR